MGTTILARGAGEHGSSTGLATTVLALLSAAALVGIGLVGADQLVPAPPDRPRAHGPAAVEAPPTVVVTPRRAGQGPAGEGAGRRAAESGGAPAADLGGVDAAGGGHPAPRPPRPRATASAPLTISPSAGGASAVLGEKQGRPAAEQHRTASAKQHRHKSAAKQHRHKSAAKQHRHKSAKGHGPRPHRPGSKDPGKEHGREHSGKDPGKEHGREPSGKDPGKEHGREPSGKDPGKEHGREPSGKDPGKEQGREPSGKDPGKEQGREHSGEEHRHKERQPRR